MSTQDTNHRDTPTGASLDEIDQRQIIEEDANPKGLIIGGIIALIVAIVAAFLVNSHHKANLAAAEALGSASTTDELEAVVADHSGTDSAGTALIEIANEQAADAKFEDALGTLERFFADHDMHPLADRALLSKASILMRLERNDEAIAALDEFNSSYSNSTLAPLAQLTRGDIEKQRGNVDAAKAAYSSATTDPTSAQALAATVDNRMRFISYTAPREVEPAPKPEPTMEQGAINGNLPPAPTGNQTVDDAVRSIVEDSNINSDEGAAAEPAAEDMEEQVPEEDASADEPTDAED